MRGSIAFLSSTAARKGIVALADQAVFSGTNFLTGIIIGRVCTKEEFGLYTIGFTIVFLMTKLQISLISTPYMVYSPRLNGSALAQYNGSTLIHQVSFSALGAFTLAIGAVMLSLGIGPQEMKPVVWTLALVITFIMLREYVRRICFAGLRMKTTLIFDSCVAVVQIGGLLLLANLSILSANLAYLVAGIACGITVFGWFISNRKAFTLRFSHAISDFGINWSLGKWVFASGLLWDLSMNFYPWLLTIFHGTGSAGVWAVCLGIVSIGNPVLFGVQNILGPKIANLYAEKGAMALHLFVLKASAVFCALMMLFCTVLLVFGGPLVVLLYGDKYAGNGLIVSALALNLLVSAGGFSFSCALFAIDRADVDFKVNFVALFVLLTVGLWLARSFGPLGAAYGLLIANTATSGVRYVALTRLIRSLARSQTG